MGKKKWYKIITNNNHLGLEKEINDMISNGEGWTPCGGIIVNKDYGTVFMQVMTRRFVKAGPGRPKGSTKKVKDE